MSKKNTITFEKKIDVPDNELLRIDNLSVEYRVGTTVAKAVNNFNVRLKKGEALGIVGESGAGKTTLALSIMHLLPEQVGFVTKGNIYFKGESVLAKSDKEMDSVRGKEMAMVFANPLTSLNPVFTVGHQIAMGIKKHEKISNAEAETKAAKLLERVGIAKYRMKDYPHQFSGGMRQRVGIAAALACDPELLIADEPTTALDVTIQAQVLELMKELQKEHETSLIMITHNLGIIAELCQNVAVMYGGEVVEYGDVREVFKNPKHWYTYGLIHAIPNITGERTRLQSIPGLVANAARLPEGCKFHPRCGHCTEQCKSTIPELKKINDNHWVACWEEE